MSKSNRQRRKFNMAGAPKLNDKQKAEKKEERGTANCRVLARQNMFKHFRGEGALGHEMTCAGRLMIVGCFDGMDADPETILSALLDYSRAYWGNYGGGPRIADHAKVGHSPVLEGAEDEDGLLIDPGGVWFDKVDELLRSAGHQSRRAVHEITVDRHWFPDEDVDWAERIINYRLMMKRSELIRAGRDISKFNIVGEYEPNESDYAMLQLARHGASCLVGERKKLAA